MLHKILKKLINFFSTALGLIARLLKAMPWMVGPLLGLAAYCPLYYFALAGSWLPHLLGICLLWTGWFLLRKQDYKAGWLGAWMLLASATLATNPEKPADSLHPDSSQLKVAQVNVLQFNKGHEKVSQYVIELDADLVAFQEVDRRWADSLVKELAAVYPYYSLAPQDNCYGMALFSKKPLQQVRLRFWEGFPAISAVVEEGGQQSLILSLHAASPTSLERYRARNKQLDSAAQLVRASKLPTLVIGDLNTVPWDSALQSLLKSASLSDSRARHYTATWPAPLGRWGIPIDYVLHSPHWQRLSHYSANIPGSDHRAMVASLALRTDPKQQQNNLRLSKR